jgi:hypothetical protein
MDFKRIFYAPKLKIGKAFGRFQVATIENSIFFLYWYLKITTMMKKLLVLALLAIGFTACEKEEDNQHCYRCEWTESTTDDRGASSTITDSIIQCHMTEQEIKIYESRYPARQQVFTTYSAMKCTQIADTTLK